MNDERAYRDGYNCGRARGEDHATRIEEAAHAEEQIWREKEATLTGERDAARADAEWLADRMAAVFVWHCRTSDPNAIVKPEDACHCDICEPARSAIAAHKAATL